MNIVINLDILSIEGIKPRHIVMFLQLISKSTDGEIEIRNVDLQELMGYKTKRMVIDGLRELRGLGLIDYTEEASKANLYKINPKYYFK